MSFGFSVADIAKGAVFCRWIIDHCFDRTNTADVHYRHLESDIAGLENRLKLLHGTFGRAVPDGQPIKDLKDLVGDFFQTLEQCQEILQHRRYADLTRSPAGFVQNVFWATMAQEKVDTLRRRIQFHTQKIYLVIEPVKLGLLTTMSERIDEILAMMRAHFPLPNPLDPVPGWLVSILERSIKENAPNDFTDLQNLPMRLGFDLLYGCFRESTWAFRDAETADQTPEAVSKPLESSVDSRNYQERNRLSTISGWIIVQMDNSRH